MSINHYFKEFLYFSKIPQNQQKSPIYPKFSKLSKFLQNLQNSPKSPYFLIFEIWLCFIIKNFNYIRKEKFSFSLSLVRNKKQTSY